MTADQRYARVLAAYASQFEVRRDEVEAWFAARVGERVGRAAIVAAGDAWADDDAQSLHDRGSWSWPRSSTQGGAAAQLRSHTRRAVRRGRTRAELEAMGPPLAAYAGQPRAGDGLAQCTKSSPDSRPRERRGNNPRPTHGSGRRRSTIT